MTKARPPSPGEQISLLGKLARDLGPFLRSTIDPQVVAAQLRQDVATRADRFVTLLERAVFADPDSPYRQLMGHAGITLADVKELVGREGPRRRPGAAGRRRGLSASGRVQGPHADSARQPRARGRHARVRQPARPPDTSRSRPAARAAPARASMSTSRQYANDAGYEALLLAAAQPGRAPLGAVAAGAAVLGRPLDLHAPRADRPDPGPMVRTIGARAEPLRLAPPGCCWSCSWRPADGMAGRCRGRSRRRPPRSRGWRNGWPRPSAPAPRRSSTPRHRAGCASRWRHSSRAWISRARCSSSAASH